MSQLPTFPKPVRVKGRLYFPRAALEEYKRALIAQAQGLAAPPAVEPAPAVIELVPANQAARELACHRRTVGRRVLEAHGDTKDVQALTVAKAVAPSNDPRGALPKKPREAA
jgi:hypothetical protein